MKPASVPGHLHHFLPLDRDQQAEAIRRMANTGWSESSIAVATKLSIEQVRRILAEPRRPAKSEGERCG